MTDRRQETQRDEVLRAAIDDAVDRLHYLLGQARRAGIDLSAGLEILDRDAAPPPRKAGA